MDCADLPLWPWINQAAQSQHRKSGRFRGVLTACAIGASRRVADRLFWPLESPTESATLGGVRQRTAGAAPSFNEQDVSDKPAAIRNLRSMSTRHLQWISRRYRSRLASLLAVDDLVERVVKQLGKAGVLENTLLIFTSDNGFFAGEHRIMRSKLKIYDETIRVPLLMRGAGFPQGATVAQPVANIDIAPTIVYISGARPRSLMDGRHLLSMALNPKLGAARDILVESRDVNETQTYEAIRNRSFLYVEHADGERELYDMRKFSPNYDPYQLESRHDDTEYRDIEARLAERLDQLRTCAGMSCRTR